MLWRIAGRRPSLSATGYNVILAGNGAEAIKQVETARPDIVLTDILMPGIDGYELSRRIKQQNPDLPVIMVTVLFDPADVLKGLAAGADSFIVKPPNPEHVCSQIEAVMRGREMAGAMVKRINNTLQFTAEYQRIGTSSPAWQEIRSLVEAAAGCVSLGAVSLENNIPPGVEVFADPLIEKVFTNLIDNALRHGEKVTRISFGLKRGGDFCIIFCEDDGVGVPVDEKEKIFSYAYGKNTGLGLFLAREILSITSITIRETGNPGEGARFEMICPPDMIRAPVSRTG